MGQCEYGSLATKPQQRGAVTLKRATRHLQSKGPLLGLLVVKHRTDDVGTSNKL